MEQACRVCENLAERTGFAVRQIVYDSTGFQFWGSEQYREGRGDQAAFYLKPIRVDRERTS